MQNCMLMWMPWYVQSRGVKVLSIFLLNSQDLAEG